MQSKFESLSGLIFELYQKKDKKKDNFFV